jgi:hypothetical protein
LGSRAQRRRRPGPAASRAHPPSSVALAIPRGPLLDFEILQPDGIKQVITALERLEKGKIVTRGRIVAGLSFGLWAGLFGRRYEELWRHRLRAVFPHGTLTRKDLSAKVRLIQHFRNRVAHHDDSLLDQDVQAVIGFGHLSLLSA